MRTLDIGGKIVSERGKKYRISGASYLKYCKRMIDLYNPMVDIINLEVIPALVHQIDKEPPLPHGLVMLYDGMTTKTCWELYNDKPWGINPTFWMLFTSDGKFATSRKMISGGVWAYEEPMLLIHHVDQYHQYIYGTVRMFDGLLEIGKKCGLTDATLSSWKEKFDLLYAEYCRAKDAMNHHYNAFYDNSEATDD